MVSDEILMQDVGAGSVIAFQTLYDRHHRVVFNFLLHSLGNHSAAEDLLQETFLRVFVHRHDYRPSAPFRTWLFTIARNLLIDRLRRVGTHPEYPDDEKLQEVADPSPSPLAELEGRALEERLQRAVTRLPPFQREVLLLSRFAGLSHEEIAQVTAASLGAVRVALHRGLRRLHNFLGTL